MIALLITMAIAILAIVGRWLARGGDRSDRLIGATIAWAVGVVVALVVVAGLSAPFSPWDMVRLAPSLALLQGIDPYAGVHSGVVLSTMYGPVAIAAYVPAALIGDSAFAAIVGRWLGFAFAFAPLLFCSRIADGSEGKAWRGMVLAIGSLAMIACPALRYSTTFLHADAPALGLLGLACLLASRPGGPGLITAVVCGLAILTKQTMLPLPVAILISVWIFEGPRQAGWFLAKLAIVGVLFLAILACLWNRDALYLNLVKIPAGIPWRGRAPGNLLATSVELLIHSLPLVLLLAITCLYRLPDRTSAIFLIVAAALAPMAVLGRVKEAGDINSFSPCLYPLLLAGICHATIAPLASIFLRRSFAAILAALALFGSVRLSDEVRLLTKERSFQAESKYLEAFPGSVYFPWNPSVHLAVEGHPAHHLFSAWERGVAGFPVETEHLRSAIPPTTRYVAFPLKRLGPTVGFGSCMQMLEKSGLIEREAVPVRLAGLADYECYLLRR